MSSESFPERENQIGDYLLNEEIGSGGFAKVVQGIHIPTGEKVAVKIMDKEQIFSEPLNLDRIQREIRILKIVRHKNIIKLYELMETPNKIYLVMEYCNGGELFDYIVSKQHLTERQACRFFQEIINSIEYLHSLNIVHRDLKPENLLLDKINNKITLKLIDFGISNCYTPDKLLNTPCGTASYAPPEMHKGEEYYGLLSDVWSAGVVLYAMAFGYLPFCEDDEDTNISNIIEGNYEIPEEASPELADLLIHLLDINPLTRYDLEQIKEHPWFNMVKPYKYIPGIIEGYHKIPIDMKIVEVCEQYGYDKDKVIESVEKCKYNRNSSVYYIILSKMRREGYHSISDLYSDEFLRYIKNQKNIIFQSDEDLNDLIDDDNNDIKDDVYNDISERKSDKGKNKVKKYEKSARKMNKFTRHQSHPLGENNFNLDLDLSFEVKEEKYNKNKNSKKNKVNEKEKKEKEKEKEKNNVENSNIKNKIKNPEQKNIILPVYKKPKVKQKKNRNEKRNDFRISENIHGHNNITINITKQTHKNNNISISNIDTKRSKNPKKEKEKEIIINKNKPKHTKNNRSFSQQKKKKPKKGKIIGNLKKKFPELPKKPENNALKTEIVRKNLNKKVMPICSFHIISKTKEMLNKINNNEEINLDFMNTSFNKKLSDDIKENILKLKNPKKKIPQKEKEKKINNALLSLKMKKQRKKGDYNYNKHFNKNKKIKITVRPPIFRDSNRKDHTLIHNRNASLCNENRNHNRYKNLSAEKNKNRNDFSFSPNINRHESHERRNIINIYVQNKNNINSNNVYNINLITKNNYSIERASINKNKQNNNYNNIKVKKVKISRQNIKSIEEKFPLNSNNYLNTANMSFNRNRKISFQTPNKPNQGMYFDKAKQILSNSNIQYQTTNNNENKKNNVVKTFNHKSNSVENRYSHKNMYNKSYNDFYNNNNKKIRINFKPIEENEIDDLNHSKKIDRGKINSNQKIKKIESKTNNNKRKNNHKAYHYKSRSLMDIDNPILVKNQPKNMNTIIQKEKNNYTITDNQKITKIRSTKCASVKNINKNNNINSTLKPKKPLINISFINLHTNDNKQQTIEPKKYKGPVDLSCLLVGKSLSVLIEKISGLLKRHKISNIFINQYKLRCTKNGNSFDIEFMKLNDNIIKVNNNSILESSYENDSKYKTITEAVTEKTLNLYYYYVILSKIKNNKSLIISVSKIINSKFGNIKYKK